jgi:hypothetical protein
MFKKIKRHLAATGAAFTTGLILSQEAFAQDAVKQDTNKFLDNFIDEIATVPAFITTLTYIVGILLAIAGIYKLKEAVDNPGQNSIQDGFIRLAAGGALIALPTIVSTMGGTFGQTAGDNITSDDFKFQALQGIS